MAPTVSGPPRSASRMDRRDISEKPRNSFALRAVACGTMVGIDLLLYIIISLINDMITSGHASVKRGKCQLIGRTWQRERLACVAGVRDHERGQRVDMEMSGRGEVVSNIVGILFEEPDRIIRGYLCCHQAKATSWRRHLLEGLAVGIKDGQEVAAHF